MSVKVRTEAILGSVLGYGKSPCFLRCAVLSVANLGQGGSVLLMLNMVDCLECV